MQAVYTLLVAILLPAYPVRGGQLSQIAEQGRDPELDR